jgi:Helix-turn-helix domain
VSVEAISWALNLPPVPAGQGGQPSSACKFVLVGLANHAGPDGTAAFPSVATLVRYTGLSERTVRTCLDRLEADGIIAPCDPDIVAARIKRADRRPKGWDLDLSLNRDAMAKAGTGEPERPAEADKPGRRGPSDGVQPPHPEPGAVNNPDRGVRRLHPNRTKNQPQNRPPPARPRARHRPRLAPMAAAVSSASSSPPSATAGR